MRLNLAKNITWSQFTCDMRDGAVLHFFPHPKNDFVPHVLRHRVLASYSAIGILVKALLVLAPTVLPAAAVYSSAVTSSNIIKLTNIARGDAGLKTLNEDSRLASAAAAKADDMLSKQYFAHVSPEGKTPWNWIRAAGYDYRHAGENLAIHFFTAEGVQEGWMASPTHRQNIVDARYADIGVGVQQGKYEGYDTVVVVQMFGVLKSAEVPPEPAAEAVAALAPNAPAGAPTSEPSPAPAPTALPDRSTHTERAAAPATRPDAAAPQPASAAGEVAGTHQEPVIDQDSVKVLPTGSGFAVTAKIENAERAQAYLGNQEVKLEKGPDDIWSGALAAADPDEGQQFLIIGASGDDGTSTYGPVAAITPAGSTAQAFGIGDGKRATVLGQPISGVEDAVRQFYMYAAMLLFAALALKVIVRIEIQRHGVIAHAMFVIGLFAVLSIA